MHDVPHGYADVWLCGSSQAWAARCASGGVTVQVVVAIAALV